MGVLAGLGSLVVFSLFFAWALKRPSALMPLLVCALAMLWGTLSGILGILYEATILWYVLCVFALAAVVLNTGRDFWKLFSTPLVLFVVASVLFVAYCQWTQPMLTHWDEFTFWGTAAKVTGRTGELYTTARSSLIARSYQPGLIVFSYIMQFFGGYSEPGLISSFMVLYLACFAVAGGLWGKQRTAAILFLIGMFFVPLLFTVNVPAGQMQWTYLVCMADLPMTLVFGGALCFYYAGGEKNTRLLVPLGILLAALVCMKDMGLALAACALAMVLLDMAFCERDKLSCFGLRGWPAIGAFAGYTLVLMGGFTLLWTWHFNTTQALNRLDFGSQGSSLSPLGLVVTGVQMLFGVGRSQQFSAVLSAMWQALFTQPVCLLGPGVVVLGIILAVSLLGFLLAAGRRGRRRVLVFTVGMLCLFAAFYVFNIFTYALVFKSQEALVLKDYARYISPFWMAWLMGALALLALSAANPKASFYRLRIARTANGAVSLCLVLAVGFMGNWQGNFLRVSPSQYAVRQNVKAVAGEAVAQGMKSEDVVYIISQGDDGTRFYMFGYELPAVRTLLYNGYLLDVSGALVTDEAGQPVLHGNATSTLIAPDTRPIPPYGAETRISDLLQFMKLQECTHVLVDVPDDYVLQELTPLFSDELAGWSTTDPTQRGHRYYRIEWGKNGEVLFVPAQNAAQGGGDS